MLTVLSPSEVAPRLGCTSLIPRQEKKSDMPKNLLSIGAFQFERHTTKKTGAHHSHETENFRQVWTCSKQNRSKASHFSEEKYFNWVDLKATRLYKMDFWLCIFMILKNKSTKFFLNCFHKIIKFYKCTQNSANLD